VSTLVEFREVSKTYDGEHMAVARLNCSIEKGEFLTFLGPSGSGKTTALMMLAGFEAPSSGDILLEGRSLAGLAPHRRNMGVVFQNYALFPHMTVAENIAFPLAARGMPSSEVRQRVTQVLALVQLSGFERRRPAELSGGQQQRVALARALVFDPDLILMDEPLGALDRQLREQLQLEIKHIQSQLGVTVIYVTHDQSEALTMSDRIAVFDRGAIQQIASPRELYERPASPFVAQFVGSNNRLTGVLSEVQDERCVVRMPNGVVIRAVLIGAGVVGEEVTLSVRPERVLIGVAHGSQNECAAEVRELIYYGDHVGVRLALAGGAEVMAKFHHTDRVPLRPGESVTIGWSIEDCRAFTLPQARH
jgi:putative spermidine/putrescine transport system ATP-binding protein